MKKIIFYNINYHIPIFFLIILFLIFGSVVSLQSDEIEISRDELDGLIKKLEKNRGILSDLKSKISGVDNIEYGKKGEVTPVVTMQKGIDNKVLLDKIIILQDMVSRIKKNYNDFKERTEKKIKDYEKNYTRIENYKKLSIDYSVMLEKYKLLEKDYKLANSTLQDISDRLENSRTENIHLKKIIDDLKTTDADAANFLNKFKVWNKEKSELKDELAGVMDKNRKLIEENKDYKKKILEITAQGTSDIFKENAKLKKEIEALKKDNSVYDRLKKDEYITAADIYKEQRDKLKKLETINKTLKKRISDLEEKAVSEKKDMTGPGENELIRQNALLRKSLEEFSDKVKSLGKKVETAEKEYDIKKNELIKIKSEVEKDNNELKEKNKELEKLAEELKNKLSATRNESADIKKQVNKLKKERKVYKDLTELSKNKYEYIIENYKSEIQALKSLENIGKSLDKDKDIVKTITGLRTKTRRAEQRYLDLQDEHDSLMEERNNLKVSNLKMEKDIKKLKDNNLAGKGREAELLNKVSDLALKMNQVEQTNANLRKDITLITDNYLKREKKLADKISEINYNLDKKEKEISKLRDDYYAIKDLNEKAVKREKELGELLNERDSALKRKKEEYEILFARHNELAERELHSVNREKVLSRKLTEMSAESKRQKDSYDLISGKYQSLKKESMKKTEREKELLDKIAELSSKSEMLKSELGSVEKKYYGMITEKENKKLVEKEKELDIKRLSEINKANIEREKELIKRMASLEIKSRDTEKKYKDLQEKYDDILMRNKGTAVIPESLTKRLENLIEENRKLKYEKESLKNKTVEIKEYNELLGVRKKNRGLEELNSDLKRVNARLIERLERIDSTENSIVKKLKDDLKRKDMIVDNIRNEVNVIRGKSRNAVKKMLKEVVYYKNMIKDYSGEMKKLDNLTALVRELKFENNNLVSINDELLKRIKKIENRNERLEGELEQLKLRSGASPVLKNKMDISSSLKKSGSLSVTPAGSVKTDMTAVKNLNTRFNQFLDRDEKLGNELQLISKNLKVMVEKNNELTNEVKELKGRLSSFENRISNTAVSSSAAAPARELEEKNIEDMVPEKKVEEEEPKEETSTQSDDWLLEGFEETPSRKETPKKEAPKSDEEDFSLGEDDFLLK